MKIKKILIILTTFISIVAACLPLYGCQSYEQKITILHAGGSLYGLTYLNSQEAFDYYYNKGYRYFEYDLKLSSDGKVIGTHYWEHLNIQNPSAIPYEEFLNLKLAHNLTPVNEEWLAKTIKKFPDVKIIVDAKMDEDESDAAVLKRIEKLEDLYNIDLSSNIIPEIFSKEMWEMVKEKTSFDKYIFSHYKVYYTSQQIIEYFSDQKFWAVAISINADAYFVKGIPEIKATGKKLLVFSPTTKTEADFSLEQLSADMLYLDNPNILTDKQ